ncbi:DUF4193 domain-containing protein [Arthrobacter sp. HLT1-21]
MATDYDTPRTTDDAAGEESIGELEVHRADQQSPVVDEDELEAADSFELPGADLSAEDVQVRILPAQADEFTCASCFLVRHRSQIARHLGELAYCSDCEG